MIFKELELNTITKEDLLNLSYNKINFILYMFKSGIATNGDEIKKEVDAEINTLNEFWTEDRNMPEGTDGTVDDFYAFLADKINEYSIKNEIRYPIAMLSLNAAEDLCILDHIIDAISYVCLDYYKYFEKAINSGDNIDKNVNILSENSEKRFTDLINYIYSNTEIDKYKNAGLTIDNESVNSILNVLTTNFYYSKDYKMPTFPLYDRNCLTSELDNLFYKQIEHLDREINNSGNISVLKDASTILSAIHNDENTRAFMMETDLYDRLSKLIYLYYKIINLTRVNNLQAVSFIVDVITDAITGKEPPIDEDLKLDTHLNICHHDFYPSSAHDVYRLMLVDIKGKRSLEAIDSAYDFGKSQLKNNVINSNNFAVNKIDDKYKAKFSKLNNIWNEVRRVKPAKMKAKINSAYFKKWYGRIPSMYSRYGSEATVTENKMKGDPTLILANSAPKYLSKLVTETNKMFQGMIDLSRRVAAASDINAKMNVVKGFCKDYKIEDPRDPKSVQLAIKNEAIVRIARCIFQDNDIYGFTPEGIVENGEFPTANHIVTSLFLDNSQEEPTEQSVSDIFSTPDSITVFAHPQKLESFDELFKKVSNSITQNFNHKIVADVNNSLELNYKNYANSLKRKSEDIEGGDADEASLNKKLAKAIENGIVDGLDLAIDQKARCIQTSGAMYDMLTRVQKLAKLCVASLHAAEVKHGDTRMNTGIDNKLRNASNVRLNKVNQTNNGARYKENFFTYK